MEDSKTRSIIQKYLKRAAVFGRLIEKEIHADCEFIIIIPAYLEEDIISTLKSLLENDIDFHCEVIIIINHSENETETKKLINQKSYQDCLNFIQSVNHAWIDFHCVYQELSPKHAGVGLARKVAMDEAVRRLLDINKLKAPIVNLDADCVVNPQYLSGIRDYFLNKLQSPGANIHYEHPLDNEGIIHYELFLRYYKNALKYCGLPYAYHTIGSSMSVRCDAYVKEGGMNRRKAGEDFYFIHKIIPRGNYGLVKHSIVYPSSRISQRVPFGTGKAMEKYADKPEELNFTYSIRSFEDLREFVNQTEKYFDLITNGSSVNNMFETLPESFKSFVDLDEFKYFLEESRDNSNSEKTFLKRIFQWIDAFKVLKFIHHCRDHYYPNEEIKFSSISLLKRLNIDVIENTDEVDLLKLYRELDQLA